MHKERVSTERDDAVASRFAREGAVILSNLFSPDAVTAMSNWISDVVKRGHEIPVTLEPEFETGNSNTPRKLRRLYWNDERFWAKQFAEGRIPQLAERLIGAPVALIFHAAFLKPAGVGSAVALHQDQALWEQQYPGAISIWVALKPSNRANGCLVGCPESHHCGPLEHISMPDHPWHPGVDWRAKGLEEPVLYELQPGDALAWHRYFVHGSGPNHSESPRWGMVMVFADRTQRDMLTRDRADF